VNERTNERLIDRIDR